MKTNTKNYAANGLAAGIAAALLQFSTPATAFSVNGVIEGGEYTSAWDLNTAIAGTQAPSRLFLRQTATDLFVGVTVDINYVDNVYGDSKSNTPLSTVGSGWENKDHALSKLTGSDNLKFTLNLGSAASANNQDIHTELVDKDNFNIVDIKKGAAFIQESSSSFVYNFKQSVIAGDLTYGDFSSGDASLSPDPINLANNPDGLAADWQQALIYEFRFDAPADDRTIGLADFSNASVHASPSKNVDDPVFNCLNSTKDCDPFTPPGGGTPPTGISEPASGALFLAGLGLVSMYRRRQGKK